jgi:hypothetical protein
MVVKQVKIYPEYSTRGGSTFFLLESGLSSGTLKAPISEGRACLEVEVLQYFTRNFDYRQTVDRHIVFTSLVFSSISHTTTFESRLLIL